MKIIFLDIDGVLNSSKFFKERGVMKAPTREDYNKRMIDDKAVAILKRILAETGARVVLSSTWRKGEEGRNYIFKNVVEWIGVTGSCCTGIRGVEIYKWMQDNIDYKEREKVKYAILDDDSDMLLWQKDHFFKCSNETGLTEEIAEKVIEHLNK